MCTPRGNSLKPFCHDESVVGGGLAGQYNKRQNQYFNMSAQIEKNNVSGARQRIFFVLWNIALCPAPLPAKQIVFAFDFLLCLC